VRNDLVGVGGKSPDDQESESVESKLKARNGVSNAKEESGRRSERKTYKGERCSDVLRQ